MEMMIVGRGGFRAAECTVIRLVYVQRLRDGRRLHTLERHLQRAFERGDDVVLEDRQRGGDPAVR